MGDEQCGEVDNSGVRVGEGYLDSEGIGRMVGYTHSSESPGSGGDVSKYRTGGATQVTTPPVQKQCHSDNARMPQCAVGRYWGFRQRQPLIRWETLSDAPDSAHGEYLTGNLILRHRAAWVVNACSSLRGGPYFAPGQNDWGDNHRVGGKKGGSEGRRQIPDAKPKKRRRATATAAQRPITQRTKPPGPRLKLNEKTKKAEVAPKPPKRN